MSAPNELSQAYRDGFAAGCEQGRFDAAQDADTHALRDQFAAQAFGPILAFKIKQFGHPCEPVYRDAASEAYQAADQALRRRAL